MTSAQEIARFLQRQDAFAHSFQGPAATLVVTVSEALPHLDACQLAQRVCRGYGDRSRPSSLALSDARSLLLRRLMVAKRVVLWDVLLQRPSEAEVLQLHV